MRKDILEFKILLSWIFYRYIVNFIALPAIIPGNISWIWLLIGVILVISYFGKISPDFYFFVEVIGRVIFNDERLANLLLKTEKSTFFLGVLLVGWWFIGNWAKSFVEFWGIIEEIGIHVIRKSGDRIKFLKRLHDNMFTSLGLGPSGDIIKLFNFYVRRKEEENILKIINQEIWKNHNYFGVLIVGPQTAGKTRTAMEILEKLDLSFILIWPKNPKEISLPSKLKLPGGRAVIFADDVHVRINEFGELTLHNLLMQLVERCDGLAILATAPIERVSSSIQKIYKIKLDEMNEEELSDLIKYIADIENKSPEEIKKRYNGHPGNLVAGLDALKERFKILRNGKEKTEILCSVLLQSARLLFELGIQCLTINRVCRVARELWGIDFTYEEQERAISLLIEMSFIRIKQSKIIKIYDGILKEVVPEPVDFEQKIGELFKVFEDQKDAEAFEDIGNMLSNEYSEIYQINPVNSIKKAIIAYKNAYRFYNLEKDKTRIMISLGQSYVKLSNYTNNPIKYIKKSISIFKEAINKKIQDYYPKIYINLGIAYWNLSRHENSIQNLRDSICAYRNALRFLEKEKDPLNYAWIYNNLGVVYIDLSDLENPLDNLRQAINAFSEALNFWTLEKVPLAYAGAQHGLGVAYFKLAKYENEAVNLKAALQAFQEALRFRKSEKVPLLYAETKHQIGLVYWRYAKTMKDKEQCIKHLKLAINLYFEVLNIWKSEYYPFNYAWVYNNIGMAYRDLAELEDPVSNLRNSIKAFEEALKFWTEESAPLAYAGAQDGLGSAYLSLSEYENPKENLERAFQAFNNSLKFRTPEQTPLLYAKTKYHIGLTFIRMALLKEDHDEVCKDLMLARSAFYEALRFSHLEQIGYLHKQIEQILQQLKQYAHDYDCLEDG